MYIQKHVYRVIHIEKKRYGYRYRRRKVKHDQGLAPYFFSLLFYYSFSSFFFLLLFLPPFCIFFLYVPDRKPLFSIGQPVTHTFPFISTPYSFKYMRHLLTRRDSSTRHRTRATVYYRQHTYERYVGYTLRWRFIRSHFAGQSRSFVLVRGRGDR